MEPQKIRISSWNKIFAVRIGSRISVRIPLFQAITTRLVPSEIGASASASRVAPIEVEVATGCLRA